MCGESRSFLCELPRQLQLQLLVNALRDSKLGKAETENAHQIACAVEKLLSKDQRRSDSEPESGAMSGTGGAKDFKSVLVRISQCSEASDLDR